MQSQVFIKKKIPGRDDQLQLAEVLAEKQGGDVLRLKIEGVSTPIEVKRADTVSIATVAPGQARISGKAIPRAPEKCYPTSRGALANQIY